MCWEWQALFHNIIVTLLWFKPSDHFCHIHGSYCISVACDVNRRPGLNCSALSYTDCTPWALSVPVYLAKDGKTSQPQQTQHHFSLTHKKCLAVLSEKPDVSKELSDYTNCCLIFISFSLSLCGWRGWSGKLHSSIRR